MTSKGMSFSLQSERKPKDVPIMDLNTALSNFKKGLNGVLFGEQSNTQAAAIKLHHLGVFIVESGKQNIRCLSSKGPFEYFADTLKKSFEDYATTLVAQTESKRLTFIGSFCAYMSRLKNLSELIRFVETGLNIHVAPRGSDSLTETLEDYYLIHMFNVQEIPLNAYRSACEQFIKGDKSHKDDLLLIHDVIYKYIINYSGKHSIDATQTAQEFFNMGETCMRQWVNKTSKLNFIECFESYQNTLELLDLIDQRPPKESGFELAYEGDGRLLLESLNKFVLQAEVINVICEAKKDNSKKWIRRLSKLFRELRPIEFSEKNFDKLLLSIILNDYFCPDHYAKRDADCSILKRMREEFKNNIRNVEEFHADLVCYMDLKFQENYRKRKIYSSHNSTAEDVLWSNALASLIVYYVPDRPAFRSYYLKNGLFRQMIMLNSKFPDFYNKTTCMERALMNGLNEAIPYDMYFVRTALREGLPLLKENFVVSGTSTKLNKLFITRELASELSYLPEDNAQPLWPSKYFKNCWTKEMQDFKIRGKKLHGLFSRHLLSVSTPIHLRSGKRLMLIGDLSMASVLYLFNDEDILTKEKILLQLGEDHLHVIETTIEKLLREGIIVRSSSNDLQINQSFEASPRVIKSGLLRLV